MNSITDETYLSIQQLELMLQNEFESNKRKRSISSHKKHYYDPFIFLYSSYAKKRSNFINWRYQRLWKLVDNFMLEYPVDIFIDTAYNLYDHQIKLTYAMREAELIHNVYTCKSRNIYSLDLKCHQVDELSPEYNHLEHKYAITWL